MAFHFDCLILIQLCIGGAMEWMAASAIATTRRNLVILPLSLTNTICHLFVSVSVLVTIFLFDLAIAFVCLVAPLKGGR